jgi:hypothetical protein
MENDEKMFPEVAQSEACLTEQPTAGGKCTGSNRQEIKDANSLPLTRILGISEEGLRTLRAEAQCTFVEEVDTGLAHFLSYYRSHARQHRTLSGRARRSPPRV